ncbi:hypothetical protein ACE6H2_002081 [Prunus campanulata]
MAKRLSSQLFVSRLSSFTNNEQPKRLFSPFEDDTDEMEKDPVRVLVTGAASMVILSKFTSSSVLFSLFGWLE